MTKSANNVLYTIGHSNHTIDVFLDLLKRHDVKMVADVRSAPYSRYCPQFNSKAVEASLESVGIEYIFLGKELGARPNDLSCYENERASFHKIAERDEFKQGINKLLVEVSKNDIALMCVEKDPLQCHRMVLICKNLDRYNFCIKHILADGTIENHEDTQRRLIKVLKMELSLFESAENYSKLVERAYDKQASIVSVYSKRTAHNF